jgi:predicted branched-subunit amino acid permease
VLTNDFRTLPLAIQIQLTFITPLLAGAVCGFLLGIDEAAYWTWQLVALLGGVAGGSEHPRASHGAIRGTIAGTMLGLGLLVAHDASGAPALAQLPSPLIVIVVLMACGGALAGFVGSRLAPMLHRSVDRGAGPTDGPSRTPPS